MNRNEVLPSSNDQLICGRIPASLLQHGTHDEIKQVLKRLYSGNLPEQLLHQAIPICSTSVLITLVSELKANCRYSEQGISPLVVAIREKKFDFATFLCIKEGVKVNAYAIEAAILSGSASILRTLLVHEKYTLEMCPQSRKPLVEFAVESGHSEIIKEFLVQRRPSDFQLYSIAPKINDIDTLRMCLAHSKFRASYTSKQLSLAIAADDMPLIKTLANAIDTPLLQTLIEANSTKVLEQILSAIESRHWKQMGLSIALRSRNWDVVRLMLQYKARWTPDDLELILSECPADKVEIIATELASLEVSRDLLLNIIIKENHPDMAAIVLRNETRPTVFASSFFLALQQGRDEILQRIIDCSSPDTLQQLREQSWPPLFLARSYKCNNFYEIEQTLK